MKQKTAVRIAGLKMCVMLDAMIAAYIDGLTFTVQGFCARYAYTPNRHVRQALNSMVKSGYLERAKRLHSDGHYRYSYFAQHTKKMWSDR